ncbi:MAG: M48 family metallopeptidase [Ideonella sp.]|nr:M48 family metallopeptidase [Ideonella sp.]MBL0151152.1 M48 family metallopeptidase [Ideonella sp.]
MSTPFHTDAHIAAPALAHAAGCGCHLHARRRWGTAALATLAAPGVWAQGPQQDWLQQPSSPAPAALASTGSQNWDECKRSTFAKVGSANQVEQTATQQYTQMLQQASSKKALGPQNHPQVQRLRYIAQRIIPFTYGCNPRARDWQWDVNLIGSDQLNAFCMPGGKIAFYYGILAKLQLSDDEVAMIMGHEVAHALLEHARERMGKTLATRGAIEIGAALLGVGNLGRAAADAGGQLLTLTFSRSDESEADALGLVLAANAGYDPQAGVTLWQKMMSANKGAPPQWLSTHPSGKTRIKDMEDHMGRVQPMFARAARPDRHFGPPVPKAAAS